MGIKILAGRGKARPGKAMQGKANLILKIMKKRIIVISDLHCGHQSGLTPPDYQYSEVKNSTTKHNKWAKLQKEMWISYINILEKYKPFDVGFSMGDMIDGKGGKSGGTELICADRNTQVDMAVACHQNISDRSGKDFKWIGVFGTAYHSSGEGGEDWESIIADRCEFEKIGSHESVDVNGCIFDLKHHIGASSIPHGRFTSAAKERLWNVLWNERDLRPKANVILRGHVHYATYCGEPGWVAMTLPSLQGMGTKFGARICAGTVHWGLVIFDVDDNGNFEWHQEVIEIVSQKMEAIKI